MATTKIQLSSQTQVNADVDWNSFKITSLAPGTAGTDAVNKSQLDSVAAGLDPKASCRLGTAADLPANTPAGSGVGKTLTADANGALTIDGVAVANGDRILVKDYGGTASNVNNGIYDVTDLGSAGTPWILTRSTDADTDAEVTAGMFTFVTEGSTNADQGFVLVTNDPITVDTTALEFSQFTGVGSIPDASETVKGIIEIATQVETDAGTDDARAITPLKLENFSKWATKLDTTLTDGNIFVGNGSNVATGVTMSGDATIDNTGAVTLATDVLKEADIVTNEELTVTEGSPTPSNLANTPITGTVQVHLNGLLQRPGGSNDYTISGSTITFNFNLRNVGANVDTVTVHYFK